MAKVKCRTESRQWRERLELGQGSPASPCIRKQDGGIDTYPLSNKIKYEREG